MYPQLMYMSAIAMLLKASVCLTSRLKVKIFLVDQLMKTAVNACLTVLLWHACISLHFPNL